MPHGKRWQNLGILPSQRGTWQLLFRSPQDGVGPQAAVSRNVAALEANLKLRLFQRSTRSFDTYGGRERFLHSVRDHLESLQGAIAEASNEQAEPAGVLKLSMSPTFGVEVYSFRPLPEFMTR